eukprot:CAMPEP_0119060212 /NCGR_PEP_ID=MMETSP1178-20130426/4217_1 /TAXON_ID=33656 /ORGANISM="unid sp, Strain CCMP2000" /LENGTH=374 /DNA_ID=CAMNT_0007041297 /DNA_START=45 /DNA_END=1169 /DNA_ORIENTATION=-
MHLAMLGSALVQPEAMDSAVASLSDGFTSLGFTADRMFEANLAVAAFVLWIGFFESLSFVPGNERWRLDGQPAVNPLRGFGRDLHKTVVPAVTYLGSIALFHHFHLGTLLFGEKPPLDSLPPPTYWRLVIEVALGVFLYDLFFYPFHASFHKLRVGPWRRQHARHHQWAGKERVAHNAVETVQNSYLDAGIQVSINILVQNISPWGFKHPLSRALHNLMVTYLLTEAHSGYDLPFMSHKIFPRVFGGAPRHELHHQHGNVYFHQFFMWIDDLAGFTLPGAHQQPQKQPPPPPQTRYAVPMSAKVGAEGEARDEAEERLRKAMPFTLQTAVPARLKPASKTAEQAGVTAPVVAMVEVRQRRLDEAADTSAEYEGP